MEVAGFEGLLGRDRIRQKVASVLDVTGDHVNHPTLTLYNPFELQ
jgi:hypothetical protein